MAWIKTIEEDKATGQIKEFYDQLKQTGWRPQYHQDQRRSSISSIRE